MYHLPVKQHYDAIDGSHSMEKEAHCNTALFFINPFSSKLGSFAVNSLTFFDFKFELTYNVVRTIDYLYCLDYDSTIFITFTMIVILRRVSSELYPNGR